MKKLKGLSLFASAGIAEFGFDNSIVDMVLANELIPIRSQVHSYWHKNSSIICGDIIKKDIKDEIINKSKKENVDFVFATPPCQGVSLIGKNKSNEAMLADPRNFLIFHALEIIDELKPKCIMIENVARFFKMQFIENGKIYTIDKYVKEKYSNDYTVKTDIYDAASYGVPQHRARSIIRMYKKGFNWSEPIKQNEITVRQAIGKLPSLEAGEVSKIKNHNARKHIARHIECMKHTPTGKSAFENEFYYPKCEKTGRRLKGYMATYKRINWDAPAPTITMRNDCISSQSNVHPGRLLDDGTYSDARVLTLRELFILSSINPNIDVPSFASDIQIRHMIGEAVPPQLINSIIKELKYEKN